MPSIPRIAFPDSTLPLLHDPYGFIAKQCRQHRSDVVRSRLLLRPAFFMTGPAAAQLFYDSDRFLRTGAAPERLQKTLFGRGGVQGLDDDAHRHRKRMFMSMMTPEEVARMGQTTAATLLAHARRWQAQDRVVLYDAMREVLTRAVCAWAGVPLVESEVQRRTTELSALFQYAGSVGPKHWWARRARMQAERWIARIIEHIRTGRLEPRAPSAARTVAIHRDLNGELLPLPTAAVELLNVLRPTVAVAVYVTFVAHALHQHPGCRQRLATEGDEYAAHFLQEVRRFYPFFPAAVARVRRDFVWEGYRFPRGTRVVLDLYGTNHDPRTWEAPEAFRPERFRHWDGGAFDLVPQGGGDHHVNHRCPGEWVTIEIMRRTLDLLVHRIRYEVPDQDLRIDYATPPGLPRSGFVVRDVRVEAQASDAAFTASHRA